MIIIEKLAKLIQCTHFELQNATNYMYLICPDPKLLILVCHCFLLSLLHIAFYQMESCLKVHKDFRGLLKM